MDTKLKSIKLSRAYKAALAVMFIACWVTLGIVTGFAGAYGYMFPNYAGVEALLIDSPADSSGIWTQNRAYALQIVSAMDESMLEATEFVSNADFYAKVTLDSGRVIENSVEHFPQLEYTEWRDTLLGSAAITTALSNRGYDSYCQDWNRMKRNMQIIVVSDIILLAAGVVFMVLLCKCAGLREDGTVRLGKRYKLPYELTLLAAAGMLYLFAFEAVCANELSNVAQLGAGGRNLCMALSGAAALGFAGSVLYLLSCGEVRAKNGVFGRGSIIWCLLMLICRLLKLIGRLFARFGRAARAVATGEAFPKSTAAVRIVIMDVVFAAATALLAIVCIAAGGSIIAVALEVICIVVFIWARYRQLRDCTVVEKKIKALTEGDYSFEGKLSEHSAFKQDMERLNTLSEGYRRSVEERVYAERMKIELVTNVSHDLKTPLTSIISYVELLSKEELPPAAQDYVKVLKAKSERLKNIVADVFELAKTTSGEITIEHERLDLTKLSWQTIGEMEDRIAETGLDLRAKICDPPVTVVSDGKRLYRVIQNLLDNALKYSLSGTRVYYTLEKSGNTAVITIKNISAYEIDFTAEEILERFTRGDKSRTTEGSGLGLSIAQGFTLACGGTFALNIDGDMFKVTLTFPLAQEAENG